MPLELLGWPRIENIDRLATRVARGGKLNGVAFKKPSRQKGGILV